MTSTRAPTCLLITESPKPPDDCWTVKPGEPVGGYRAQQILPLKRRPSPRLLSMPVATSSQSLLASLPSFMSVFDDGSTRRRDQVDHSEPANTAIKTQLHSGRPNQGPNFPQTYILRRNSASTFRTESTDSSPTTTISTVDSSLTEPSPSSSPESPNSMLPLSPYDSSKTTSPTGEGGEMDSGNAMSSPQPSISSFNRTEPPNKKMRNTKNLSLNTSAPNKQGMPPPRLAISSTSTDSSQPFSAPPTPSFHIPPKQPKRFPSSLGLSIRTPHSGLAINTQDSGPSLVPETPLDSRPNTLKHLDSMPNLPLCSPTVAPVGGMQLPPFSSSFGTGRFAKPRPPLSLSQPSSYDSTRSSPLAAPPLEHVPEEKELVPEEEPMQEERDYDPPLSQEPKSPAYPEGPVCVYDSGVYLYLEPTDKEASEFDVIINVAKEVLNPFAGVAKQTSEVQDENAKGGKASFDEIFTQSQDQNMEEPPSAISDASFHSAIEEQQEQTSETMSEGKQGVPEYIHIPWDHNSNVIEDLLRLCELIDDRVQQQKRILIHCQCGVSRSASLVVAYGLYKNPSLTFNDAYEFVKSRSRWIGPNMNLVYHLSDFREQLQRQSSDTQPNFRLRRNLGGTRLNVSANPNTSTQQDPEDEEFRPSRAKSFSPPGSAQFASMSQNGDISPGPASAPPDMLSSPTESKTNILEESESSSTKLDDGQLSPTSPKEADIDTSESSPSSYDSGNSQETILAPLPSLSPLSTLLPGGFSSISVRRQQSRDQGLRQTNSALSIRLPTQELAIRPGHALVEGPQGSITKQLANVTLNQTSNEAIPETPSILSPRAAEFTASPFHRTIAGDLAGSSMIEQGLTSPGRQEIDPRSPVHRGEAPIIWNIDDVL